MNMRILSFVYLTLLISSSSHAESSLAFDSALGFTSNGYLTATNPTSDRILSIGGVSRFDLADTQGRASLKYSDYGSLRANNLLSADFGSTWKNVGNDKDQPVYGLRAALRDYVNDAPASTDQGYSHFGLIGDATWKHSINSNSEWLINPRIDLEHYTAYLNRSDVELSSSFDFSLATSPDSNFTLGLTPIFLVSTLSDFSKLSLVLSADYYRSFEDDTSWGASASLAPGWYTSRTTGATATIVTRSRKGAPSASTVSSLEKEATITFTPGLWCAKELNRSFELRAETNLNLQDSKSGSYNFTEVQAWVSVHYRVF